MEKKKRGGARAGAGRKGIRSFDGGEIKPHGIRCSDYEYKFLKIMLNNIRKSANVGRDLQEPPCS